MRTKTDLPEPARERTVAFASVILALSLFSLLAPDHGPTQNEHSATNSKMQDSHNASLPRDSHPGWGPVSF
ncbi:MAG: hypothetical protein JO025_00500 [Verrucomicrobia bacterium]|nr:hypothetical protein [Verrucomicrobiota bacterium]